MTVAPTSVQPGREHHRLRWALVIVLVFLAGGLTVALIDRGGGSSSSSVAQGSGIAATDARQVAAFTRVDLAGSNNVLIHVGGKQSVVVHADDNLLDRVTTQVRSGELVVGNTPGSFSTKSPMSVAVTVPALTALTLSGSGNIVVDGVSAKNLVLTLSGSGTFTGGGAADRLAVTVGGSGTAQLTRLVAHDVRAVVSGTGSIFVTATRSLDASVSGSGSILYAGNPQSVTKSVTGSGSITGG